MTSAGGRRGGRRIGQVARIEVDRSNAGIGGAQRGGDALLPGPVGLVDRHRDRAPGHVELPTRQLHEEGRGVTIDEQELPPDVGLVHQDEERGRVAGVHDLQRDRAGNDIRERNGPVRVGLGARDVRLLADAHRGPLDAAAVEEIEELCVESGRSRSRRRTAAFFRVGTRVRAPRPRRRFAACVRIRTRVGTGVRAPVVAPSTGDRDRGEKEHEGGVSETKRSGWHVG